MQEKQRETFTIDLKQSSQNSLLRLITLKIKLIPSIYPSNGVSGTRNRLIVHLNIKSDSKMFQNEPRIQTIIVSDFVFYFSKYLICEMYFSRVDNIQALCCV